MRRKHSHITVDDKNEVELSSSLFSDNYFNLVQTVYGPALIKYQEYCRNLPLTQMFTRGKHSGTESYQMRDLKTDLGKADISSKSLPKRILLSVAKGNRISLPQGFSETQGLSETIILSQLGDKLSVIWQDQDYWRTITEVFELEDKVSDNIILQLKNSPYSSSNLEEADCLHYMSENIRLISKVVSHFNCTPVSDITLALNHFFRKTKLNFDGHSFAHYLMKELAMPDGCDSRVWMVSTLLIEDPTLPTQFKDFLKYYILCEFNKQYKYNEISKGMISPEMQREIFHMKFMLRFLKESANPKVLEILLTILPPRDVLRTMPEVLMNCITQEKPGVSDLLLDWLPEEFEYLACDLAVNNELCKVLQASVNNTYIFVQLLCFLGDAASLNDIETEGNDIEIKRKDEDRKSLKIIRDAIYDAIDTNNIILFTSLVDDQRLSPCKVIELQVWQKFMHEHFFPIVTKCITCNKIDMLSSLLSKIPRDMMSEEQGKDPFMIRIEQSSICDLLRSYEELTNQAADDIFSIKHEISMPEFARWADQFAKLVNQQKLSLTSQQSSNRLFPAATEEQKQNDTNVAGAKAAKKN